MTASTILPAGRFAATRYASPVGPLLLVAGAQGMARVAFLDVEPEDAVLQALRQTSDEEPRPATDAVVMDAVAVEAARAQLDAAGAWLDSFFAGAVRASAVRLDLSRSRGFRADVLDALRGVTAGTTVTYAALAAAAGRPRAVRAAASACATNPLPILIPCHRVVRSDGSLGGYLGGIEVKRALLALEERHRAERHRARP
jgi:methylated-DNA-[protein]-cysteine S-methyltransferase